MIRKLKLDLDGVKVETFESARAAATDRGTVDAYVTGCKCDTSSCDPFDSTVPRECLPDTFKCW